jgi:formate hydrogenlyase transcriptional activator
MSHVIIEELQLDLRQQLSFETLLSDISSKFINLPVEEIDENIEETQRQVCECLGFELSALWQWTDSTPTFLNLTHYFAPPDGPARPIGIKGEEAFPWTYKAVMEGATVNIHTAQLPETALVEAASRYQFRLKSTVAMPLRAGGKPIIGVLSFDNLREEHHSPPEIIKRLQLVAEIFCNALTRKSNEMSLRESETRLSLAAEIAGAGIWEYDCKKEIFWVTEKTRSIFGFDPNVEISMNFFQGCIHPEDLSTVRQVITDGLEKGNPVNVEYRIKTGVDRLKWIFTKGTVFFDARGEPRKVLGVSVDISQRKSLELQLKERLTEIESLKQKLEGENYYLREELLREKGFEQIVGKSKALKKVLVASRQVAATDATVLILGETGTGKGLLANAIHKMSSRRDRLFVTVNCAALPANLIESELFGREKGAFTGAHARQAGRFEIADRGTIFLDEIGELPLELQAKLLRVLQDGEFERLGSARTVKVDARVIAATARDLNGAVRNGQFRQDLFYRLNVFPIAIPPLRQRREDIVLLTQHFVEKFCRKMGKRLDSIPRHCIDQMLQYDWPGNVRELEHLLERSLIISEGSSFTLGDQLKSSSPAVSIANKDSENDLASIERDHIMQVLRMTEWKIEGSGGAASILNLHPSTLRFRIKKLGILRPL